MERSCLKKKFFLFLMFFCVCTAMLACDFFGEESDKVVSSRAYSGHENDADANNFVKVYPSKVATRLDDCQTCHGGGTLTYASDGTSTKSIDNACNWCHYIEFPDTSTYTEASHPQSYYDTLNSYGRAYMDGGRSAAAIKNIASLDSDGDGYSNGDEIADNRYPGNSASMPGQPLSATIELTWAQITAMTRHNQFMLMNTTKQQYDDYVNYTGVTIASLLETAGVDMTGATGVTVFAPDGFKVQFDLADITDTFPEATFYRESGKNYGNEDPLYDCTTYPANINSLVHGDTIGSTINTAGLRMILAYQREGVNLSASYYDGSTGKLEGEGPYRLVIPQRTVSGPDRGSRSSQKTTDDGYNFVSSYDHNAGSCNRGACIIRVDPMPAGYEEYDTTNGWSLITDKKVVIYGQGVN